MYSKILTASLFALGLATSAYAQTTAPTTDTTAAAPAANTADQNASSSSEMKKPKTQKTHKSTHATKKHSMKKTASKTKMGKCGGGNQAANNSGTGKGSLQTQGGMSDATPMDSKCASINN